MDEGSPVDNAMVLLRSTYGSEDDAADAARRLVERRVACCVHVSPLRSVYRWKGRVEDEQEWLLEARTPVHRRDDAWNALLDGHPYDNPLVEVVAETVVPARYAQWAQRCVADSRSTGV